MKPGVSRLLGAERDNGPPVVLTAAQNELGNLYAVETIAEQSLDPAAV